MEGQTVYTSFDCLDEVFLFKEEDEIHSFLHDVITDYSNVMVDMDDLEFDKLIDENPFIKSLVKRPDKKIFPLKPFFDNIESEDLSNFPRDIFLLKKPKSFCDTAMEKFGVLTLKSDKLSEIDLLAKRKHKSYEKGEATDNNSLYLFPGWESFVEKLKITPINSAVLIDNHLFNNYQSGKINVINLIGSILPQKLEAIFHLLLVIDNREVKFNEERLLKLNNEIKSELEEKVGYEVEVGIVTHSLDEEFHLRALITNYHIIKADYGFDCFDKKGTVKKSNEISTQSAYFNLKYDQGDPEIKLMSKKLKSVKKLISRIENSETKIITNLIVGNFHNRLLNDF